MKSAVPVGIVLFFAAALPVSAAVSRVNVSATGDDSHVSVNNTVNSSSTTSTSTTTNGHTSIRIESNGQVKTYESDEPGNVHLESDDGHSVVDVHTNSGGTVKSATTGVSPTPEPTSAPEASASPAPVVTAKPDMASIQKRFDTNVKKLQDRFIEAIRAFFDKLFGVSA